MLICLDAGHGGSDPGACGHGGLYEKDVALDVVKRLACILIKNDIDVIFTRDIDSKVELNDRSGYANSKKADFFVSVHCNAAGNTSANGTETLIYKSGGNAAKLATMVQAELINELKLSNRGVKEQNVSVLRKTNMPAILVELAFISNLNEEQLLKNDSFRQRCANSIAKGVLKYMGKNEIDSKTPKWQLEATEQFCNRNGLDTKLWLAKTESNEPITVGELFGILNKVIK